jgi:hypothetical protein
MVNQQQLFSRLYFILSPPISSFQLINVSLIRSTHVTCETIYTPRQESSDFISPGGVSTFLRVQKKKSAINKIVQIVKF